MNKWILAALVVSALLHDAPPVSAQSYVREGYTLAMIYDSQGAQHLYANGYDGAVVPPMVPQKEASSVRRGGLSPLDAYAQAGIAGTHRTKRVSRR